MIFVSIRLIFDILAGRGSGFRLPGLYATPPNPGGGPPPVGNISASPSNNSNNANNNNTQNNNNPNGYNESPRGESSSESPRKPVIRGVPMPGFGPPPSGTNTPKRGSDVPGIFFIFYARLLVLCYFYRICGSFLFFLLVHSCLSFVFLLLFTLFLIGRPVFSF